MDKSIPVEVLSYPQLIERADAFLSRYHPTRTIPVPIEDIIDQHFKIDVVPLEGLLEVGVDSFTSQDLNTIYVDNNIFLALNPNRLRFSLAHELSHVVLHKAIFDCAEFVGIQSWMEFLAQIPKNEYRWIEWQAYSLAGLILVPPSELAKEYKLMEDMIRNTGLDIATLDASSLTSVARYLGKKFQVSVSVIDKRAVKDGYWSSESLADS